MRNLTSIALMLLACNTQSPDSSSGPVHYVDVRADAQSLQRPIGLCQLAEYYTAGAGVYRVLQMTGFVEQIPEAPKGSLAGFTYVDLELLEAWTADAPTTPRVRIPGGPSPREGEEPQGFTIDLAIDEPVGLLIEEPSSRNLDQLGLHELTVFHADEAGRFSNGQLTFDAAELGKNVRAIFDDPASVDCKSLVPPESGPPQPTGGDVMVPGVTIGQTVDDDGNPI
ncbi:MAG TPA: hypothetical protein VJU61_19125 [Polyangiaceae bacterium]|nr:hypothetical protein [Polyangiaceae bacterium]